MPSGKHVMQASRSATSRAPRLLRALAFAAAVAGAACIHERRIAEPVPSELSFPQARRSASWRVLENGRPVGWVVFFEAADDASRSFYSVRNDWHQELGMIDSLGRAWKRAPHAREAIWLGAGTVTEGAARVLGTKGDLRLEEADPRASERSE